MQNIKNPDFGTQNSHKHEYYHTLCHYRI